MANPYIDILSTFSTDDHEAFLQTFRDVHDAIRRNDFEKLLFYAESPISVVGPLNLSLDPLLSIVITYQKSGLAIQLIEHMSPWNLLATNFDGDTALHVAVAKGDESVVEKLVDRNGDLLRSRNNQQEIPLHHAALFGQGPIFWKLVEKDLHPSIPSARREDGATMLHLAIMGNAPELALEIARRYPDLMTSRNVGGVTPLQLMVTIPDAFRSQLHLGPLESLIYEWIPLVESSNKRHGRHVGELEELSVHETSGPRYKDEECRQVVKTSRRKFPHSYATCVDILKWACIAVRWAWLRFFYNLKKSFTRIEELERLKKNHKQVLELIAHLARYGDYWGFLPMGRFSTIISEISGRPYTSDEILRTPSRIGEIPESDEPVCQKKKEKKKEKETPRWDETPLILGAQMGLHEFVEHILKQWPGSLTLPDTKGRNVLHVAIQHRQEKIVEIIRAMASGSYPIIPSSLFSSIQEETKNTILHFAAAAAAETVNESSPATQMQYELQWFERVKSLVPKHLHYSRNKGEKTALELFIENHETMVQKGKEQLMEIGKTYSSLVAAVVFASSFSIPGEKDVNNIPVFLHKTAFKIFSHAYVIGLSCATTALVLFLSLLTSPYRVQDFRRSLPTKYFFANVSFFLALVALLVAFICNIYLNIYGGRKAKTKDIAPLVCELTFFPAVCLFVLLYRGSTFGFGSFMQRVWR